MLYIYTKVTDFVPYIDNNVKLLYNEKNINISSIDNNKSKEYIYIYISSKIF